MRSRFLRRFALCLLWLPCIGFSSNVTVSPIHIHFSPHDTIESLQITNVADKPVNFQASIVEWAQHNEKDVYSSSDAFILSPPLFTIPAGLTQVMRIGIDSPTNTPPATQKTYRLYLTEIVPNTKDSPKQKFRLRLSLPVFIDPANPVTHIQVTKEKGKVQILNTGNMTVTIGKVDINNETKTIFLQILPGSSKTLPLPISAADKLVFYEKDLPLN